MKNADANPLRKNRD